MKRTVIAASLGLALCAQAYAFELTSTDIKPGGRLGERQVANGFGCSGGNQSPQLSWKNPPAGTRSYAITVHDPDAPTGSGWWHWQVWNIPADVDTLAADAGTSNTLPAGAVVGRGDTGGVGYFGACPPKGDKAHRYVFKVHALKVDKLELPENPMPALVGFMVNANSLSSASLTARFGR